MTAMRSVAADEAIVDNPAQSARIDFERGRVIVGSTSADRTRPIGSRGNVPVDVEHASKGEYVANDKTEHVYRYGVSPASVWNTNCSHADCYGWARCHTNIVTVETYIWQMTAQHCVDKNYYLYPYSFDGKYTEGQLSLQSNGEQRFTRSDGNDIAFYRIPAGRGTNKMFMRTLSSPLYRTNIGTMNPLQDATYCYSSQDTQTTSYGFSCGWAGYYGLYGNNSGENHFGWLLYNLSKVIVEGDSGTAIWQQLANGQARTVGVMSKRRDAGGVWFGAAANGMAYYGMTSHP